VFVFCFYFFFQLPLSTLHYYSPFAIIIFTNSYFIFLLNSLVPPLNIYFALFRQVLFPSFLLFICTPSLSFIFSSVASPFILSHFSPILVNWTFPHPCHLTYSTSHPCYLAPPTCLSFNQFCLSFHLIPTLSSNPLVSCRLILLTSLPYEPYHIYVI
jgi:hypothetical protein